MGRKKKSINEMKIAILLDEDLSIDSIINRHIELVSNPTVSSHLIDIIDGKPIFEENVVREAKPAPRRVISRISTKRPSALLLRSTFG